MDQQHDQRVAAAFERLFRTYTSPGKGLTAEEALQHRLASAQVYFEAVASYEAQDVETAVDAFLAGTVPGHNVAYAPPAPQVGAAARQAMVARLDSEHRARMARPRLPPPDVPKTPESRARVKNLVAGVVAKLSNKSLPFTTGFEADD